MDLVTATELTDLAAQRGGTRVSLVLPTHRGAGQRVRNRIRLTKLLRLAEDALRGEGLRAGQIDEILDPARRLLDRPNSAPLSDGLAMYCAPDGFRRLRVPLRLPELVAIGDRFMVRPLLPLLTAEGHFYVLALGQDEIRLFEGTRLDLDEVALDGLPLAVWLTMPPRPRQVHAFLADRSGTGGTALFHGGGEDEDKPRILHHFQRVDRALRDTLPDPHAPLVLAGARSMQAIFRRANTHRSLLPGGLDADPSDLSADALHHRAWSLVAPVLRAAETAAITTYRTLQGTGRTSNTLPEVLDAARHGRVETLFVSSDQHTWRADGNSPALVRLTDTPDSDDHMDLAAVATLHHGGQVYAVPDARMPDPNPVAASLRY